MKLNCVIFPISKSMRMFSGKNKNESVSILPCKAKNDPEIEDEAFPRDSLCKRVDWVCYAEDNMLYSS